MAQLKKYFRNNKFSFGKQFGIATSTQSSPPSTYQGPSQKKTENLGNFFYYSKLIPLLSKTGRVKSKSVEAF